jgi:hypothetical protein
MGSRRELEHYIKINYGQKVFCLIFKNAVQSLRGIVRSPEGKNIKQNDVAIGKGILSLYNISDDDKIMS